MTEDLEEFLRNYAEALKKMPKERRSYTEKIVDSEGKISYIYGREKVIEIVKDMIETLELTCPHCGKRLIWKKKE